MIEADKRKAVFLLHQEGMAAREIARRLHLGRNTVNAIIAQAGQMPEVSRALKQPIDAQLLQHLFDDCQGWIQRVHDAGLGIISWPITDASEVEALQRLDPDPSSRAHRSGGASDRNFRGC